jgi:phosphoserine phosphatase
MTLDSKAKPTSQDMLRSWQDGPTRKSIVEFVEGVAREGTPSYVPPPARIAVFDNDGTLWCEKPLPIQTGFLLGKLAAQAEEDASFRDKQPWKAVYEKDQAWLANVITKHYGGDDSALHVMGAALLNAYAGETVENYAKQAEAFLRDQHNPALRRPYLKTAYQPMRELLRYLESRGFSNYIVSGGGCEFMRPITRELYGIPPERVVGTTVELEYRETNGRPDLYHTPKLEVFDDGPTKVVRIWSRIGARPIFAAGNSNGDLQMLKFAADGGGMALLVNHDDGEREVAYSAGAEKALLAAKAKRWVVASMATDWNAVFSD